MIYGHVLYAGRCTWPFQINLLIAEPFYSASMLPWHDLHLWYMRTALADKLAEKAFIMPQGATLRAIAVQFDHLWKIRAPVGKCEGFNITHFDKVIDVSLIQASKAVVFQFLGPVSN